MENGYSLEKEYKNDDRKGILKRIVFVLLAVVAILVIIFFVLRACGNKVDSDIEVELLSAAKEHYQLSDAMLPAAEGECATVRLTTLLEEKLIDDETVFADCDKNETSVKVCKLESGIYHYTPIIKCDSYITEFGNWTKGDENDLVTDKSDVRFTYIGEEYEGLMKAYYPKNKTNASDVKEYYISAPATGYINKSDKTTAASKYYVIKTAKTYWNGGALSSTAPSGYPSKGAEGASVTLTSETQPASASYRTITSETLYRSKTQEIAEAYKFKCRDAESTGYIISPTVCEKRTTDDYKITVAIYYTCDGTTDVPYKTVCSSGTFTSWTTTQCTDTATTDCESKTGYTYTDKMWKWYKTGEVKSYYPGGSSTAAGEKTYYITAPVSGAKKDSTTTTTAYKFYKEINTSDNKNITTGTWNKITTTYVNDIDLLKAFVKAGYDFDTLKDIEDNAVTRYTLKLEFRNRN